MLRILSPVLIVLFFAFSPVSVAYAEESDGNVAYRVYVDAAAQNNGNGKKNSPFNTIGQAKDYVRTLSKDKGDIVVEIADGFYELEHTLLFDERDSGNENCRISYVAADNAYPVISRGKRIKGEWTSEGNGIYSVALDRDEKLRSLYVNGQRWYTRPE